MEIVSLLADYWLVADEWIGGALGLLIVYFLIRQNVWAWPLGVAYVLVSITVLLEARLYANLALHLVGFLPLNLYGWYHWLFGGEQRDDLPVSSRQPRRRSAGVGGACIAGALDPWLVLCELHGCRLPVLGQRRVRHEPRRHVADGPQEDRELVRSGSWSTWFRSACTTPRTSCRTRLLYLVYIPMAAWGYWTWLGSMGRRLQ